MLKNDWLLKRLDMFSDRTAVIRQDRKHSYQEISDGVSGYLEILGNCGIGAGECVALHGDFSPDITMLLLALIRNHNIVVPLTPSVSSAMGDCLRTACATSLFEFENADTYHMRRISHAGSHPLLEKLRRDGEAGLILFTSGSSGEMKAALHSFPKILSKFGKAGRPFVSLGFLLPDHIGGINTLLYSLCAGGTIVVGTERTPDAICQVIERHGIELLPTTPTFLRMLMISGAYKKHDLSSLRLITYGTEPMPPATLEALVRIFPDVGLKQTYGLTETGILPTRSESSDSLGVKLGGDMKIVDGILHIRPEAMMLGYLNAHAPIDEDGWYDTGDAVETTDSGYLRILGRDSEIINVGGEKVFPGEIENTICGMDNVRDVTVRGIPNPVTGNIVAATVELRENEPAETLEQRVREFCGKQLPPFKVPAIVEKASGRLHNGRFKKIRSFA
ncbi:fatty acid--CoA ligase family protein [Desulfobacterales bacterium HSG2]|nr:fatty acid--CoA ligase family protein [Desulfobacterales bacterium HSG2]